MIMKKRLFIIILAILFAFGLPMGYGVQNPSTMNPAGYTTTPQSSIRSGMVNTSNSIDYSGNQIVTGNVRQGKSFYGNVPYQSTSSFSSTLGSASLNSFMRDSTGSEDIGDYSSSAGSAGATYQPYQLPSSTVTTMSQVSPKASTQMGTIAGGNTQSTSGSYTSQNLSNTSSLNTATRSPVYWQIYNPGTTPAQTTQTQYDNSTQLNPLNPRTDDQQTSSQNTYYNQDEAAKFQQYSQQTQQNTDTTANLWDTSQSAATQSAIQQSQQNWTGSQDTTGQLGQLQQTPTSNEYSGILGQNSSTTYRPDSAMTKPGYAESIFNNSQQSLPSVTSQTQSRYETGSALTNMQKYQPPQPGKTTVPAQNVQTTEAIAQIQKQLDDLIKSIDNRLQNTADYTAQYSPTVQDISTPSQTDSPYRLGQTTGTGNPQNTTAIPGGSNTQISPATAAPVFDGKTQSSAQTTQPAIPDQVKNTTVIYDSYESFSQAKYNQLYRAAEGHLSIGRFHQAADAFTLAAIYKPDDPACHAGRGHALFAAGEYVSGALFIIRAIEIDPQYLNNKIDFVELLGDAELLNNRLVDLQLWLQKSNAPGLGFLLCYVYYHTGNLDKANQLIDIVCREMPQSRAATALKTAIGFKLKAGQ